MNTDACRMFVKNCISWIWVRKPTNKTNDAATNEGNVNKSGTLMDSNTNQVGLGTTQRRLAIPWD